MSWPEFPIWIVDLLGSALMILFSFLCARMTHKLRKSDPENVVWTYLLWFCYALTAFSVSRGVGHIAKRLLLLTGNGAIWNGLRPFSGAVNTLMFVVVASITLFFERIWQIYEQILQDKQRLNETKQKLLYTNRHLEELVAERTRELTLSENKYRSIFEASLDMILVTDRQGIILDINPAGMKMLAINSSDIASRRLTLATFFHTKDRWKEIKRQLVNQGFVDNTEVNLVSQDHRLLSVLLAATMEHSTHSNMARFLFLVKDISQRKAMLQQLLQADKLASIGQLAAGIAHEINNPLSIILGYTQLLIRSEVSNTERYTDLRTIEKHARACKTIVEDLLNFSRSTQTRKETSSLHQTIEEVLNVVRHQFELDNVVIQTDFDPDLPPLVLDKEKIQQVFMNLVMNAKQAIGETGTIRVSTSYNREDNTVIAEVQDTGSGIEPHHMPRIFDPFFTTKQTGEGTGLGLSVSYGIVKHHGGNILVQSEPGKGSTFSVILPVNSEKEQNENHARNHPHRRR